MNKKLGFMWQFRNAECDHSIVENVELNYCNEYLYNTIGKIFEMHYDDRKRVFIYSLSSKYGLVLTIISDGKSVNQKQLVPFSYIHHTNWAQETMMELKNSEACTDDPIKLLVIDDDYFPMPTKYFGAPHPWKLNIIQGPVEIDNIQVLYETNDHKLLYESGIYDDIKQPLDTYTTKKNMIDRLFGKISFLLLLRAKDGFELITDTSYDRYCVLTPGLESMGFYLSGCEELNFHCGEILPFGYQNIKSLDWNTWWIDREKCMSELKHLNKILDKSVLLYGETNEMLCYAYDDKSPDNRVTTLIHSDKMDEYQSMKFDMNNLHILSHCNYHYGIPKWLEYHLSILRIPYTFCLKKNGSVYYDFGYESKGDYVHSHLSKRIGDPWNGDCRLDGEIKNEYYDYDDKESFYVDLNKFVKEKEYGSAIMIRIKTPPLEKIEKARQNMIDAHTTVID